MKYFAVLLRVADADVALKYRPEHVAYLQQLCKEGKIYRVGGLMGKGGLVIYQADSIETVEEWVANDPFVEHGARTPEIFEWEMSTAEEYIKL